MKAVAFTIKRLTAVS